MKRFFAFIKRQFEIINDLTNDHRLNNSLPGLTNYKISLTHEPKSYKIYEYFIASIVVTLFVLVGLFVFYYLLFLFWLHGDTSKLITKNCFIGSSIFALVYWLFTIILIIFRPKQKEPKELKELNTEKTKKIKK